VDDEDDEDEPEPESDGDKRAKSVDAYYTRETASANKHLAQLNTHREQMPVSLKIHGNENHPFTMVKMPIVPLFDRWTVTQEHVLKRLNIPHIPLAGYMIFEDQLLLIVSKSSAFKAGKVVQKKTADGSLAPKRMLDFSREAQKVVDYANVILDIINERSTHGTFSMVSDKFVSNPRNQDLVCFWIMGTQKLSALIRAAGATSKVKTWGFPWTENVPSTEIVHTRPSTFIHPSKNPDHPQFLEYDQNKHLRPHGWKSADVLLRKKL
jgi:hypothetical protein